MYIGVECLSLIHMYRLCCSTLQMSIFPLKWHLYMLATPPCPLFPTCDWNALCIMYLGISGILHVSHSHVSTRNIISASPIIALMLSPLCHGKPLQFQNSSFIGLYVPWVLSPHLLGSWVSMGGTFLLVWASSASLLVFCWLGVLSSLMYTWLSFK